MLQDREPDLNWEQFAERLLERFSPTDKFHLRSKFYERKQGGTENVLSYIESKLELANKAHIDNEDSETIAVIQRGLTSRFANLALTEFSSLKDFMTAARKASSWHERTTKRVETAHYASESQQTARSSSSSSAIRPIATANQRSPLRNAPKSPTKRSNPTEPQQSQHYARTFHRTPPSSPTSRPLASSARTSPKRVSATPPRQQTNCYACGKSGHIARNCSAKQNASLMNRRDIERTICEVLEIGAIPGVTGVINGHKVRVVLDTGCSALLISAKCANRCGLKAKWQEDHPIFIGANGKYLKYRGTVKCNLKLEGYELELRML
ncbi:hypothetical protein B4U79_18900, partial [Dinothrombium tinctorium]